MDQAIAAEWGRFLKEIEAQGTESVKINNSDNNQDLPAPEPRGAVRENIKQVVWQRLQDAIASPPESDSSLLDVPAATADGLPASGRQSAARGEKGAFQMRSVWVGSGFEERPVPVAPPSADAAVSEKQQMAKDEDSSVQAPTWMPDENHQETPWQSAAYADAASSASLPANGTSPHTEQQSDGSRWFVLKSMLEGGAAPEETAGPAAHVPVLEVFSLAGGVGKTSLVATLGRALSASGERVLLVEATPFGALPYFFGACDCRPGELRTFRPPASRYDAPIRMASIDPESLEADSDGHSSLVAEIQGWAQGASRVIVDVATRSTLTARELSQFSPVVLVPLVPDVVSVVAADSIDSFFHHHAGAPDVYYLLNQFDASLPLHADVRKVLQERLGERLLPFALQRTPAVSEALAEGMTIVDYAPDSPLAEDFNSLAKWLEGVLAPAEMNSRDVRWSER
jgi:cellulose biosynthesis protein BcsQ